MNNIQSGRGGRRYLFDRAGVYLCLLTALSLATAAVLLVPFEHTYIEDSGADAAYHIFFIAMAATATIVFILGMFYNAMVWMDGALSGIEANAPRSRKLTVSSKRFLKAVFSRDFGRHLRVFVAEGLLLRKLRKTSRARWLLHALVLFGFLGTFILDIVTVIGVDILQSQQFIDPLGWGKLWIRDFGFELFGLMLLVGLLAAALRRLARRSKQLVTGREDATSLLFLLIVVLSGFILEGVAMNSAIPGHESPAMYSFVGAAFAQVLPSVTAQVYAQLWLVHAAISFAFIAYIPFSKLFHLFAAPLAIHLEEIVKKGAGR
jgi:nitrate reductase gamma subunit